jgi:hypothetical protein
VFGVPRFGRAEGFAAVDGGGGGESSEQFDEGVELMVVVAL